MGKIFMFMVFVGIMMSFVEGNASDIIESKKDSKIEYKNFKIPVVVVKRESVADKKRYYAKLEPNQSAIYSVVVRSDGFLQNLFVSEIYAKVTKNAPLFSFYSPELIDAQSEFLVTSQYNHAHLARQKLELLGVSASEIAKVRKSGKISNEVVFYAPISGVVFAKNFNVGSGVKKGDEIFRIVNLDTLWVVANINQEDLRLLDVLKDSKAGSALNAYMSLIDSDKKVGLKLDRIYPNVTDNYVKVRFILDNKNGEFYPNMFANVYIESSLRERLLLPKSALLYKNKKHFVFVESDGEFIVQEVSAKRVAGSEFYEITDGLDEGEIVAKNALFMLDSDAQNNGDFEG